MTSPDLARAVDELDRLLTLLDDGADGRRPTLLAELDDVDAAVTRAEDVKARRLPADATRALFAHERTAGVLFAELDAAQLALADRLAELVEARRRLYVVALIGELVPYAKQGARELVEAIVAIQNPAAVAVNAAATKTAITGLGDEVERELLAHRKAAVRRLIAEANAQGLDLPRAMRDPDETELAFIRAQTLKVTRGAREDLDQRASLYVYNRPVYDRPAADTLKGLADTLAVAAEEGTKGRALTARTAATQVEANTRAAVGPKLAPPRQVYASELLDRNTCGPCGEVDGREYASVDDARRDYPAGTYIDCKGGDRCRGTLVFVWADEAPATRQLPPEPGPRAPRPPRDPDPTPAALDPTIGPTPSSTPKLDAFRRKGPLPDLPPTMDVDTYQRWADAKDTNPGYGERGYDVNCVHVVNAYELRRRGLDVVATRLPEQLIANRGRSSLDALRRWRYPAGHPRFVGEGKPLFDVVTAAGAKRTVKGWPVGARGWVVVRWKGRGSGGHIFSVEQTADGPVWVDAQVSDPNLDVDSYFRRASKDVLIVRTDELIPTDEVVEFLREVPT